MITPRTVSQPVTALPWRLLIAMWLAASPVALATGTNERAPAATPGCLPTGNGYLRARIRGALDLDLDWRNAELQCEGELRPDGSGLRISFAGPEHADGRRTRLVFGVGSVPRAATTIAPWTRSHRSAWALSADTRAPTGSSRVDSALPRPARSTTARASS
jgi:hypothetical protein